VAEATCFGCLDRSAESAAPPKGCFIETKIVRMQ
jgi:hypothetical protein